MDRMEMEREGRKGALVKMQHLTETTMPEYRNGVDRLVGISAGLQLTTTFLPPTAEHDSPPLTMLI